MKKPLAWFRSVQILLIVIMQFLCSPSHAQDLEAFRKKVTEFTLKNGLRFIVVERHQAPVVSFHTYADVGSVDEVKGITGVAHLFEHMAFKGTMTIGTRDINAELEAMARLDAIYLELKSERQKRSNAEATRIEELESQFKQIQEHAATLRVLDEYNNVLTREGATGLNASTVGDATRYYVSLPSNKLEFWMSLESDRFLNPVMREFYKERDVVMEERRLRTESRPIGRLLEEFMAVAYKAHPYGEPVVGHMSDLQTLTRHEAEAFFKKYYAPGNLTIAVVGDVESKKVKKLAETYFGRIPPSPKPDPVETVEPPQLGERRVVLEDPSQPFVLIGYHKPSITHEDNAVFDAINDILGRGRTSRLNKSLVKDKKIAIASRGFQGLPGNKYPGMFLFFAVPAKDHSNQECEEAINIEIERLKTESVTEQELRKAKTRSRAALLRQLSSNAGLAEQLTFYDVVTGDWENLFKQLEAIDRVTAKDIQRVANTYFMSKNRTVGRIETTQSESSAIAKNQKAAG